MSVVYRVGSYVYSSLQEFGNIGMRAMPQIGVIATLALTPFRYFSAGLYTARNFAFQAVQKCRRRFGAEAADPQDQEIDRIEDVVEPIAHPHDVHGEREPRRVEVHAEEQERREGPPVLELRPNRGVEEVVRLREEYVGNLRRKGEPELAYILNRVFKRILKDPTCNANGTNFMWVSDQLKHHVKKLNRKPSIFLRRFWAWMARPIRKCSPNHPANQRNQD